MQSVVVAAGNLYHELGALAFLIVCVTLAFGFLIWRIVKTQDKISSTLERISERQVCQEQRSIAMHSTCLDHGQKIENLRTGLSEVKSELGGLTTEVRVLQERTK